MPRMSDFAHWGVAISQAMGYSADDFLQAYGENIKSQNEEILEGHPVAAAVLEFMEDRKMWEGAPSELLEQLNNVAQEHKIDVKDKRWPKAAQVMTRRLNEVKANLIDTGISLSTGNRSGKRRTISLIKSEENTVTDNLLKPKLIGSFSWLERILGKE